MTLQQEKIKSRCVGKGSLEKEAAMWLQRTFAVCIRSLHFLLRWHPGFPFLASAPLCLLLVSLKGCTLTASVPGMGPVCFRQEGSPVCEFVDVLLECDIWPITVILLLREKRLQLPKGISEQDEPRPTLQKQVSEMGRSRTWRQHWRHGSGLP